MDVDVLNHTENPERTVCAAARGDEMEMSMVGVDLDNEDDYAEVMESVPYDDDDVEAVTSPNNDIYNYTKRSENHARTRALIHRLIRTYGHYGPFEHTNITFAAEGVSIVVERQITRHRHVTWDVQSLRYVDGRDMEVHTPESIEGRMCRGELTDGDVFHDSVQQSVQDYIDLVECGMDKEYARYVLPMGIEINMTFTLNLRTLMHLCDMRIAGNVQTETIEFAKQVLDAAEEVAPNTVEVYREHAKGKSKDAP